MNAVFFTAEPPDQYNFETKVRFGLMYIYTKNNNTISICGKYKIVV
jgi:hypothetical protein